MRFELALPRGRALELTRRPRVLGILNVTPDSFSDGGLYVEPERAVERGLAMLEEGADMLDVGAESTRPGGGVYGAGADQVDEREELRRLLPVIEGLRRETDAVISVDTRKGEVAREALRAGADLVNDVGGLADPLLAGVVAEAGCPLVLMHSRGELKTMQRGIRFDDVVDEVRAELRALDERARTAGIAASQIVLDPGIGFGKTARQNLRLIAELGKLRELGRPILLGASRKSFIRHVDPEAGATDRLGGSLAAVAAAAETASILRVHDVRATVQFLGVLFAIHLAGLNQE